VAALASSNLDDSFELESMSLAAGTVDEMASYDWLFRIDSLHLRNASPFADHDIAIL